MYYQELITRIGNTSTSSAAMAVRHSFTGRWMVNISGQSAQA